MQSNWKNIQEIVRYKMKTTNIMIRVSEQEKQKIKEAAEKLQMSVSEYILMLHRQNITRN